MAKSRAEKITKNVFYSIATEAIKLICGLVLPRLILTKYGSAHNGIVQSVSQFLSMIALMKLGIGSLTRASLFKPLAENNDDELNKVLSATEAFMRRLAYIFAGMVLVFACIYPFFVLDQFSWLFSATLIIIISISTFAEYYFGFTYQVLISADQKDYISSILAIITTILNTIISVILINNNFSIHIVKLGSALANIITPITLYIYCHKHYHLKKVKSVDINVFPQRWDALTHELASFVNDNTDVIILTLFSNLLEISVYSVYHYVTVNLKKIITSLVAGFSSAFGDMYARKQHDLLIKNYKIYELISHSFTSIVYAITMVMIIPFVLLYTKKVVDVNYNRLYFSILITLGGAFDSFRYPYKSVINTTGHFRGTKRIAICESCINIFVSIICVIMFGLEGVAIGTFLTMLFGCLSYSYYLSKSVLEIDYFDTFKHLLLSILTIVVTYLLSGLYLGNINSYLMWVYYSCITGLLAVSITMIINFVFYKDTFIEAINIIKRVLLRKVRR